MTSAMLRALGLFAIGLLLAGGTGCQKSNDALVVVTVSSVSSLAGVTSLHVDATAAGQPGQFDITPPGAPVTLPPPQTFAVEVPHAVLGDFHIVVTAVGASGALAVQSADTTTKAGDKSEVTITFGAAPGDGGVDGSPSDGGSDGSVAPCTSDCGIVGISPEVAKVGDKITLEGRFGTSNTITFNGNVTATLTKIGPSRGTVVVPAGAVTGSLSLTADGAQTGSWVSLHVVTYTPGLGAFRNDYAQASTARAMPQLKDDRGLHAVVSLGTCVIALGGQLNNMQNGMVTNTFEIAMTNADGTLQPFNEWATTGSGARSLVTARAGFTALRLGNNVYAIGGWNGGQTAATSMAFDSIEQAQINGDGSGIQTFTTSTTHLNHGRFLHAMKVIGPYLYVFGGFASGSLADGSMVATNTIERAPISPTGALGAFTDAGTLMTPRGGPGVEVIGNTVYVLGGINGTSGLTTIEKATINPDGTLGPFSNASTSLDAVRAAFSTFVANGKLYVVGGVTLNNGNLDNTQAVAVANIDASNDSLGAFSAMTSLTRAHAAFGQGALVGNNYYVVGGGNNTGSQLSDVEYAPLDTSGGLTPFMTDMKTSTVAHRTAPGIAVVGNRVYLFGGQTSAPLTSIESAPIAPDGTLGAFVNENTTLMTARSGPAVAVMGNSIYVYGGGFVSGEVFNVQMNGGTASLSGTSIMPPTMTSARQNFQLVITGKTLYALGGDGTPGTASSTEYVTLDPVSGTPMGTWTAGNPLAQAHAEGAGVLIGSTYYLINNATSPMPETDTATRSSTDGTLGAFSMASVGIASHGRWYGTAVDIGPSVLLLGGTSMMASSTGPDPSIDQASIVPNAGDASLGGNFMMVPSNGLQTGRRSPVAFSAGNYVYVLDGYSTTDLNSVEVSQLK